MQQFGLRYLLGEIALIAFALAIWTVVFRDASLGSQSAVLLMLAGYVATGTALGGLSKRWSQGAILGFLTGCILLLPALYWLVR